MEDRNIRALQRVMPNTRLADAETFRSQPKFHVHVGEAVQGAPQADRRVAATVMLNLLPRMFNRITASGVSPADLFPQSPTHASKIGTRVPTDPAPDLVIALSDTDVTATYPGVAVLYVDSRGWSAYLSRIGPCTLPTGPANPIGAFYAGARAAGEAFNVVAKAKVPRIQLIEGSHSFDLVTLTPDGEPSHEPHLDRMIQLDDVAIIGVGAVGSGIAYALGLLHDLRGRLRLIDHEPTDETNEGRYLLAFPENRSQFKALIAWEHLSSRFALLDVMPGIPVPLVAETRVGVNSAFATALGQIRTFPIVDYATFQRAVGEGKPMKLVVATVDSAATRRDIQFGLHKTIVNGWTNTGNSQLDYGIGRHTITGPHACCACIYHEPLTEVPTDFEFARGLTGWEDHMVRRRLREEAHVRTNPVEAEGLRQRAGVPPAEVGRYLNKTLSELIRQACGEGGRAFEGRSESAPVFHLPALVAAHLTTQIVLESIGHPGALESVAVFDSLIVPGLDVASIEGKRTGCLCKEDDDVRQVYEEIWA